MKRRRRSLLVRSLVSIAVLALLFAMVDLQEFVQSAAKWDFRLLPVFLVVNGAAILALAFRWKVLLRSRLGMGRALISTSIGLGANQVLAARAGDVLRAIHSARSPGVSVHQALAALALEKIVDLITVGCLGLIAVVAMAGTEGSTAMTGPLAIAVAALLFATGVVAFARRPQATEFLRWVCRTFRVPVRSYRHVRHIVRALVSVSSGPMLLAQTCLSILIWLVLYCGIYIVVAAMLQVMLSPAQAITLLFAGAIGMALPGAPSGIGTFHAAIVSGGILVGIGAGAALALATAIHGLLFISYAVLGGMAYVIDHQERAPISG